MFFIITIRKKNRFSTLKYTFTDSRTNNIEKNLQIVTCSQLRTCQKAYILHR
ncbi:hypothetical protein MNBD_GAMMA21-1014 [hydrothermal vent metagenome]|uniref:Uncharacterized protein n=1 Tax=hydrothermal vent metagenome TaxID=652676 RepID=A0A3B1A999_9ZZZZ